MFQLKEAVGVDAIREREVDFIRRAIASWSRHPAIEILGNPTRERLSIVSFVIRAPRRAYLHHNFVVALLNDLFGIQARGGCSCAGPYGHRLLGIDLERSQEFEREIARGCEGIKPGWVRVNFNYFLSESCSEYIVDAVTWSPTTAGGCCRTTASTPMTGLWRHRDGTVEPPLRLGAAEVRRPDGILRYPDRTDRAPVTVLAEHLAEARRCSRGLREPDG